MMKVGWRRIVLLGLVIVGLATTQTNAQSSTQDQVVVRIRAQTAEQARDLSASGLDLLEMRDGSDLFAIVTGEQQAALQRDGWITSVDQAQTTTLRNQSNKTVLNGYRTVEEGYALLDSWQASYPDLAQVFSYGQSWDAIHAGGPTGYELKGITLTNRLINAPKPTFFLISAIHAREMTTAELTLRFIDYLLTNYATNADVHWLLDSHQVVIVPFVNPDGRKIAEQSLSQRKNRNTIDTPNCSGVNIGVDLNRNSSFHWGEVNKPTDNRCGATWPGVAAESEPEVADLQNWIRRIFPDQRGPNDNDPAPDDTSGVFISLHSYSNLVLWPYGSTYTPAPNSEDLSGLGTKLASYNGYTPQQSIDLYPTSGTTDDWLYGERGVAAFTFEVGPEFGTCSGFFPDFRCLDAAYSPAGNFWGRNLPAFLYAAKVARTPYITQRGPDALNLSVSSITRKLNVTINDTANGNQPIMAAEAYVDVPPWQTGATPIPLTAIDGNFNSPIEAATATLPAQTIARHIIYVRGKDSAGNWGAFSAIWLDSPTTTYLPLLLK